ncbi:terminase large subunit [Azospirillum tabaci]|uniref:terminase large subunit n=1 Tax=Azospirillum tabaci TaxID=2752310 RepID=UPI001660A12A|nr:terminase large subunit [Azospirillum tabaci]
MDWTTACPDWEDRILNRQSLIPFAPLFPSEAEAALDVFNQLRIVDAPGSPMMGDAARPWLKDFVASIFGSYDPNSGRRLITEYLLLISKKNAKSTGASGIMMTALLRNWRLSGEFQIIAPTIEVANNSFFPARDMIRADPELTDLLHVQEHVRTITHRQTKATLKVIAADSDTVSGKKAIGTLVDELWLFGKRPNAENMLREAIGGLASRPEGFVIYATTQSDDPPAGVFRQKLQYARGVRDGRIQDKRFLPVLYEFPERVLKQDGHRNKANFYVTNPNLGASVDEEFLEREFDKAAAAGEESLRGFLSKHLNVEIGLALRSDRWAGADFWDKPANIDRALTLEALLERSEVVVVGIDGGGLDDLLGLTVLGRCRETRKWLLWNKAWAHRIVLERRKQEAARLLGFQDDGDLAIVDQPGDDVAAVADIVMRVEHAGLLADKGIGVDAAGIGDIVDELTGRGIDIERIIGIPQGWKLNSAIKTTERKLAGGDIVHGGRPLMAWSVGNAKAEPKGNAVSITKQASGNAKIDPLMAVFDAVALMATNPEARGGGINNFFASLSRAR